MVGVSRYPSWEPILERWPRFDDVLGTEFWVVRDDLLPFPLAGNKVRKISGELDLLDDPVDVLITNGGIDSNHCRTLAMMAARSGMSAHLVLHGHQSSEYHPALRVLDALGATFDVGPPETIGDRINEAQDAYISSGKSVHIVSGGGHTVAGAKAFRDAGAAIFRNAIFEQVFVASGTGATQGGLVAAAAQGQIGPEIIGVSVARDKARGIPPVSEAAGWAGAKDAPITFLDNYRAGGYGQVSRKVVEAVRLGWEHGMPLDYTYSGKAFSAIVDYSQRGLLGSSVLFWHTGGLWNWLNAKTDAQHSHSAAF